MSIGLLKGLKQQAPTTGSVATGQAYAQQIAGGMPFEQVVAPGLQFSPEAPMGLTQEELDFIAKGPAPVMPVAPTIGEPVAPSIPTISNPFLEKNKAALIFLKFPKNKNNKFLQ